MPAFEPIRVSAPDGPRVAALLARAFQDDPEMVYAFADATERARALPRLISLNVRYGLLFGEVYAAPDWQGAAVWLPPGQTRFTVARVLRAGMLAAPLRLPWRTLRRLATLGRRAAGLHARHAPDPHWYLSQLGVEPTHQRQGIASGLLAPILARCDAERLPCYLETANPANIAFYQRHGFAVVDESRPDTDIPGLWALRRDTRS